MPRPPCFIANWKMNKVIAEAEHYLSDFLEQWQSVPQPAQVIIAPPFTALDAVSTRLKQQCAEIALAAQNVHFEPSGPYTGEVSTEMLCEIGCVYVMIGHSERRMLFGENDEIVHQKLAAVLKAGLIPILCIGETLQDRRAGLTWQRLSGQLNAAFSREVLKAAETDPVSEWMIAYEPVWSIGTGETPEPAEVSRTHEEIQGLIRSVVGTGAPRILYGGSVSENNIGDFMKEPFIDGVLVGGASLSADTFFKIIEHGARASRDAEAQRHKGTT